MVEGLIMAADVNITVLMSDFEERNFARKLKFPDKGTEGQYRQSLTIKA